MLKKLLFPLIFMGFLRVGFTQSELTMPWLETVYQASYINPAALPEHKISIGLPAISSIQAGITNTGFTLNQLIGQRTDTALILNEYKALKQLRKHNFLYTGVSMDLFHIRVKVKHNFYSFHIKDNLSIRFAYPYDFVNFLLNGNGNYIGKKMDMSGLAFDATYYREYAFGIMHYDEKKKLSYGGRVKFLQGLSNIDWKNKQLWLNTGADMYRLDVGSNGTINTSLPVSPSGSTNGNFNAGNYLTNFHNKGAALDFGVNYRYSDRLILSAAISNLGFINWKTNVQNYSLQGGTYFAGVDPVKELYKNSTSLHHYVDSLKSYFQYTQTQKSYTTTLPARLYLSARYKLYTKTELGLGVFMEKYQTIRPAFTLALNQKIGKWFEGVITYSAQYRSFSNIGLGIMVKPGPVQFYFSTDNIIRRWTITSVNGHSFAAPMNARFLNFRLGMNLVIFRIKEPNKQPIPEN